MSNSLVKSVDWYKQLLHRRPAFTFLLSINVLVFIVLVLSGVSFANPTASELLAHGGLRRYELEQGEYWRLFSVMFIHAGIAHLAMNMLALHISTMFLAPKLSNVTLVMIYLVCGVIAGFSSVFWYENAVAVGASGAIAGLFGVLLVFAFMRIYPPAMAKQIKELLLPIIGFTAILGVTGFMGNLDNAAHLGGLLSGMAIGLLMTVLFGNRLRSASYT